MKIKLYITPLIIKLGCYSIILFSTPLLFQCQSKGPVSFPSKFIGQSKSFLVQSKGTPSVIKRFENSSAFIYKSKEEYYGKKKELENAVPKKTYIIEYIYYVDSSDIVYKYQVWKKRQK